MALADNVGNNLAPNSLCTSPDGRGSYPNTKTFRGNPYTYPADGYADAAYTDKYARANGHAGVDISISEMDERPGN